MYEFIADTDHRCVVVSFCKPASIEMKVCVRVCDLIQLTIAQYLHIKQTGT